VSMSRSEDLRRADQRVQMTGFGARLAIFAPRCDCPITLRRSRHGRPRSGLLECVIRLRLSACLQWQQLRRGSQSMGWVFRGQKQSSMFAACAADESQDKARPWPSRQDTRFWVPQRRLCFA
jgi:hypothetical protein